MAQVPSEASATCFGNLKTLQLLTFRHCNFQTLHRQKLQTHLSSIRQHLSGSCNILHVWIVFVMLIAAMPAKAYTNDEYSVTAMVGGNVILNCHIEFPDAGHPVPYVVQWEKKGLDVPVYIWYDGYPTHSASGFMNRVSHLDQNSGYGWASLNITNIKESDQGWYECKVVLLNRPPKSRQSNGTWFYLDVHAPPYFVATPDDVVYVSIGDQAILNCVAEGSPMPEVMWYRQGEPVHPSPSIGVVNDGTELRLAFIRQEDIDDYTCVARNSKGRVTHTTKIVIAGSAVIVEPPRNQTRMEGEEVELPCEARGHPGNFTTRWIKDGIHISQIPGLDSRASQRRDGSLILSPIAAEDQGFYACEVSNGIGEPQLASAFLEVVFPARVTFVQTVQYLPLGLSGAVQCFFEANPPVNLVTWTKDRKILDTSNTPGITYINNGTLLFHNVTMEHQGHYTCTPFNYHGTAGSSARIDVLVREPPMFTVKPKPVYQKRADEEITLPCEGQGSPPPVITWRRVDGRALPRDRARIENGYLIITTLRRTDFGFYECVVQNEVAAITTRTHILIEGTTPHAPYNVTAKAMEFSVEVEWLPGYSGGTDYTQDYQIWYKLETADKWTPVDVAPGMTKYIIHNLQPGTLYEFQVVGKNILGDGMLSGIIKERTKGQAPPEPDPPGPSRGVTGEPERDLSNEIRDYSVVTLPKDPFGMEYYPKLNIRSGPKPNPPHNLTISVVQGGYILKWIAPKEDAAAVAYYTVDYQVDTTWKRLSKTEIMPSETSFFVKNLMHGKSYHFRVNAHTLTNQATSEIIRFQVPQQMKDKAVTAGIVGGILFFIVAIILSVCTVKICNKRRRRKQEKAYNMVACRITEARNGSQAKPIPSKRGGSSRLSFMMGIEELSQSVNSVIFKDCLHFSSDSSSEGESEPSAIKEQSDESEWIRIRRPSPYSVQSDRQRLRYRQKPKYHVYAEYTQPPGYISRSADGRFVLESVDASPAKRRRIGDLPPWLITEVPPLTRHDYVNTPRTFYPRKNIYQGYPDSPIIESGFYRVGRDRVSPQKPILRRELSQTNREQNQAFLRTPAKPLPTISTIYDPSTYYTPGAQTLRSIRSSSPGPTVGRFVDDLSSVAVPSSVERSFPSTILTSDATPTSGEITRTELPSLSPLSEGLSNRPITLRKQLTSPVPLDTPLYRIDRPAVNPLRIMNESPHSRFRSTQTAVPAVRPRRTLDPFKRDTDVGKSLLVSEPVTTWQHATNTYPSEFRIFEHPRSPASCSNFSGSQQKEVLNRQGRIADNFSSPPYVEPMSREGQDPVSPSLYSSSSGSHKRSPPVHVKDVRSADERSLRSPSIYSISSGSQGRNLSRISSPTMAAGSFTGDVNIRINVPKPQTFSQIHEKRIMQPQTLPPPGNRRLFPYISPPGTPRQKVASPKAKEETYPLLQHTEQRPLATSSPPYLVISPVQRGNSITSISSGRGSSQIPPRPPQQESISSSSGFESKNTSQQNQSSSSGSQSVLQSSSDSTRLKPVPRVRAKVSRTFSVHDHHYANIPPPLPLKPPPPLPPKKTDFYNQESVGALDISVDHHYEFDSTPSSGEGSDSRWERLQRQQSPDDEITVEDRVKAIRQEYEMYRRKRERLESAC
ncbi:uncharacterized protein LOC136029401 isoform X2 [Artemia franciscana]|uniref:uncharacterized protein LOC136029401 isoform X2 n=1 Tax=Artemia franciscana TaxID=6661 RepID=UPI0032DB27C2